MPTRATVPAQCRGCGSAYMAREYELRMGRGKYCGRKCASSAGGKKAATMPRFIPEATEAEKSRARGQINYAIKTGKIIRPSTCCDCGKTCKPDADHHDYSKGLDVKFRCRSCHMKKHYRKPAA